MSDDYDRYLAQLALKMRTDWNRRATEDARYYIATSAAPGMEAFLESGRYDAQLFFRGLEALLHDRAVVLDIGCGIGRITEVIAPNVARVVGIDISDEMIAQARSRLGHLRNVEFLVGSGRDFDGIPDRTIDVAFSYIVLQHVPKPVAAAYLADLRRVLVPGGQVLFQVPELAGGRGAEPPDSDTFELRTYDESEVRAVLLNLGYQWLGAMRHPLGDGAGHSNHLRVHARWLGWSWAS